MKSKTKISKQLNKKRNPVLVETILAAKKNENWLPVAAILAGPRKKFINLNLQEIDGLAGKENSIVVSGKVLSHGEVTKKIKVVALNFSKRAREKLLKSKSEVVEIIDEIKKNPDAKNIKILTKEK